MPISSNAASYETIGANQSWRDSWDGGYRYLYLTVEQSGYYDLTILDYACEAGLYFYMIDMDLTDYCWYNTNIWIGGYYEEYTRENIYLIENHLYEIVVAYGDYDSDYNFVNFYADLSITFEKTDYVPLKLTLGTNKNLFIGRDTYEWLEFETSVDGDYLFTLNDYADFNLDIYEKKSGAAVSFTYFDFYTTTRLNLKANTEYIIKTSSGENSDRLVRLNITKAINNIKKIDILQQHTIWADNTGIYDDRVYLYYDDYSKFKYKVSFSNSSFETYSFDELKENGISINDVEYTGDICYNKGENFLQIGNQPVVINYMNGKRSNSYIYVTSYVEWLTNIGASIASDYGKMKMAYEDGSNIEGYWLIRPDKTNNYNFYSPEWYKINTDFTIFDQNNNVVLNTDGYNLKGGQLYSLRAVYTFEDYYSDGFVFSLQPNSDHEHSYKNTCDADCNDCGATRTVSHTYKTTTTKATLTKNGSVVKKCTLCGDVASKTTIKYAKTVKLSDTSYTYNGKVKKPSVIVKDSAGKTISSKYYTVKYASGRKNVGKYKVTVTFKGNYSGTKTLYFTIKPKAASVNKLTAKSKAITVKLNRSLKQSTGYQIQYSTSKSFKTYKTKKITSYKTNSTTLSGLKSKKTYYVRVRTYKTVNGKTYYSNWSSSKSCKTK